MKKQIDRPIARLIQDLDERGLLDRTLVVIATEFGRTIASAPAAGQEPDGFAERNTGEKLVIENEKMYGFHGHFSSCSCDVVLWRRIQAAASSTAAPPTSIQWSRWRSRFR